MNSEQERKTVEYLLMKREFGGKLTDREERVLAYSPYGYGGGCSSCVAAAPDVPTAINFTLR